jgi:hypothetical protein
MINHNSNILEAGLKNAGSGSLWLQFAVANLYQQDFTGTGNWPNRVGAAIATSGSFVDSGSLGWGFNGGVLNVEPSLTLPNLGTTGFTVVYQSAMGTSDITKQTLLWNNISDATFGTYGFAGSSQFYNPISWSCAPDTLMQKGTQPGDTPCSGQNLSLLPNSLSNADVYSLTYYPTSGTITTTINDTVIGSNQPYPDNGFQFDNTTAYTFGNFPAATSGATILNRYARFRGSLKRFILYTKPLTTAQIVNQIYPNLLTGL